jgi:hypothetical protein
MIIVVSFCFKSSQLSDFFHYKGYFLGQKINEIEVRKTTNQFYISQEYLLKLEVIMIKNGTLVCHLIQFKKLEGLSLL